MVPDSYHDFFAASAGVAGALIGLLFVAISIIPEKLTGDSARIDYQTRAVVAFSALVDALVLALDSLVPGVEIATVVLAFGCIGLSSTAGAGLRMVRETSGYRDQLRQRRAAIDWRQRFLSDHNPIFVLRRVVLLFGIYLVQVVDGARLLGSPHSTTDVSIIATLILACFLFAIDRAWELLGGSSSGILAVVFTGRIWREGADGERSGAPDETPREAGAQGDAPVPDVGQGVDGGLGTPADVEGGATGPPDVAPAGDRPPTG